MAIVDRRGVDVDEGESASGDQEVTGASATIDETVTTVIVNRTAPAATALTLPNALTRLGRLLRIVDLSQSVTDHVITLTPYAAAQKIMRQSTWPLYSSAASLASLTLRPIVDPDDDANAIWIIAP
ncbi:MAG: hypothetical protein IT481_08620 [Gammaproteobacteria bacterium]|nr:hypothetical protein [Gammaproteobacteria bacterium]